MARLTKWFTGLSITQRILAGVVVLAVVIFGILFAVARSNPEGAVASALGHVPLVGRLTGQPAAICPLTGEKPAKTSYLNRPAVGLKIENLPLAYPDSGLNKADIIFEEPVEGGLTRFLAVFHCGDASKAGPVRSARPVDPFLLRPITRLLGDASGDRGDLVALRKGHVISLSGIGLASKVHQVDASAAMRRIARPGLGSEHTLYANTAKLRKIGKHHYKAPPPRDIFNFGKLAGHSRPARKVTVSFENATIVNWKYRNGRYYRYEGSDPFRNEGGSQLSMTNILVLRFRMGLSKTNVDVAGNAAPLMRKPFGSGKALLFRDGRVIKGRWHRKSLKAFYRLTTSSGDQMLLKPGRTLIEVLPNKAGQITGSVVSKK